MNIIIDKQPKEKIIVVMTSWPKRIQYCANVITTILHNTRKPDMFILTLSTEEFPNKENDLPNDLLAIHDKHFQILWVEKNTKTYKKLIPVINLYPNDIIITVDDDRIYPNDCIDMIYKDYLKYHLPISCGYQRWYGNPESESHYGPFTLIKREFVGDYLDILYNYVTTNEEFKNLPTYDDVLYTYAVWCNGYYYKSGYKCYHNASMIIPTDTKTTFVSGDLENSRKYHKLLKTFIKENIDKSHK